MAAERSPERGSDTMRAAIITHPGGPEVLEVREVPRPRPQRHEVLVRVHASALNRADILQRMGRYPAPPGVPADIPGMEFAGTIADAGEAANRWNPGQRVMGIIGGGAHAEYVTVNEDAIAAVPDPVAFQVAGAVPEVFMTAYDALLQAGVKEGEYVLVHAAASGVGLAAIQLAKQMKAIPFGTTRSGAKTDAVVASGAAAVFSLATDQLDKLVAYAEQYTYGNGFDVVLDLAGGPYVAASLNCLALKGRIVCIGTPAGNNAEIALHTLLFKRARVIGTVLRARSLEEKVAVTRSFAENVVPLLASGKVNVTIDSEFPLEQIADAHRRLGSNETIGKVALRIAE
jgi:putative PIG3 family NAD(P)H quinone oxidoreductase